MPKIKKEKVKKINITAKKTKEKVRKKKSSHKKKKDRPIVNVVPTGRDLGNTSKSNAKDKDMTAKEVENFFKTNYADCFREKLQNNDRMVCDPAELVLINEHGLEKYQHTT